MNRTPPAISYRRLAVTTTALSLLVVAIGGAVRATDSGLACPTWPGCFSAGDFIPPADLHVWLEHTHRLIAGVVGLLIAWLAVWTLARHRDRRDLVVPALAAAVLVLVQSGLGALVVLHLLRAELVTAHLGLAMIVVACLLMLAVNATGPRANRTSSRLARAAAVVASLAYVQILVGGHVTGIGAGLAFRLDGFPLLHGAVFPVPATEAELFHAGHRWLGGALAVAVVWLSAVALRDRRRRQAAGVWTPADRWLVRLPLGATVLVALQAALGIANLATELSFVTVIPHLAVASWIWTVLFLLVLLARRATPVTRDAPVERARVAAAA